MKSVKLSRRIVRPFVLTGIIFLGLVMAGSLLTRTAKAPTVSAFLAMQAAASGQGSAKATTRAIK